MLRGKGVDAHVDGDTSLPLLSMAIQQPRKRERGFADALAVALISVHHLHSFSQYRQEGAFLGSIANMVHCSHAEEACNFQHSITLLVARMLLLRLH